ncbi:MAG TPA: 2-hydroxyacyl-CoA dehydratase family protein [Steroidobacteraceae bacterium]|nr:2-hydroxyacyl-CoA dehydratase family protein [Steroidobacteraceae bacterium]
MHGTRDFSLLTRSLRDDPQAAARSAAASGQRVVGYVGNDVPAALILAAGALPVRLRVNPDSRTANADRFVESSFSHELRVIAEQWMQGALDHIHAVIFARCDDSGQRLYYYLCELQRRSLCSGPLPLLFDAAGLARDGSFEHTLESTRILASQLGASAASMERALERVKQREALLRSVLARRLLPSPLPGSAAFALAYAADCDWRPAFDESARQWLDAATPLNLPRRVLLAGDPLPDDQLHSAIEAAGGSVVLELTESQFEGERTQRDPLAAIAEEFQRRESPAMSMRRNPRWLADRAAAHRADAVVVWLSEQNEALPWEIARQMQSLRAAGIPALQLARQHWRIPAAVLTQVEDFLR